MLDDDDDMTVMDILDHACDQFDFCPEYKRLAGLLSAHGDSCPVCQAIAIALAGYIDLRAVE